MTRIPIARSLAFLLLAASLSTDASATMPPPQGSLCPEVASAFQQGLFTVPDHSGLSTSARQTAWFLPVIMVEFSDSTLRRSEAELQHAIFDTTLSTPTGSVVDYWNWVSGNRMQVRGEVVARVTLPHPEEYYANSAYGLNAFSTPRNDWGLMRDALILADPLVNWNRFDRNADGFVDMVWLVHAGIPGEGSPSRTSLWSVTTSMGGPWSNGSTYETDDLIPGSTSRRVFVDRFTVLPEMSFMRPGAPSEIGVFCHEFGHALGLPDLYDTSALGGADNMGPGNWSLMSSGTYGGDGHSPEYPTHPGAWCMLYLNFASKIAPARDTVVTIPPLSSGGPVYELFYQGESQAQHFLVEARRREGFDRNLPEEGLLVTEVDDFVIGLFLAYNRINAGPTPGLRVIEPDGDFDLVRGANRGDASDVLPGSTNTTYLSDDTTPPLRLFDGRASNLVIENIQRTGASTRARFRVQPAGWFAVEDVTEPAFAPTMGFSRGRHAVVNGYGDEIEAFSDDRSGISQVLVRSRAFAASGWSASQVVSQSSGGAYDPTVALLPGNGFAIAWADLRDGSSQIYYRARTGAAWGPETRVSANGGGAPAVSVDPTGQVNLTWLEPGVPRSKVQFVSFPSGSPGGSVVTLSDSLSRPSAPCIASAYSGDAWVLWPDLRSGSYTIYFARVSPDSGAQPALRFSPLTSSSQPSVDTVPDARGGMHVAWQLVTPGASEIHYQRRLASGALWPAETTLVSSADPVQNPTLAVDRLSGVHLAFERSTPQGQMVRYMRWRETHGWDPAPCDVSDPTQGSAGRVNVVAITPGDVNVLFSDLFAGTPRLRERRRRLDPIPLAAETAPQAAPAPRLGPNPLRAGGELVVDAPELALAQRVDLFDAAGRRVATAAPQSGRARFTPAQTRSLTPGLYFLRAPGGHAARLVVLR